MIDQLALPSDEVYRTYETYGGIADAIKTMVIRGAPAIGIAAAYGMYLGAREAAATGRGPLSNVGEVYNRLADTRPTAVNLFWALDRMRRLMTHYATLLPGGAASTDDFLGAYFQEAVNIHEEDVQACLDMGTLGAELVPDGARILTHCNAGGLATGGYGTALGIIRAAHAQGKVTMVYADETRPYLQGARLTTWELHKDGVPVTLITDSMAAHFMQKGQVDLVVVGTDRTVANGDVANKIGTYGLAVLCKHHGIPFYVAAPLSTIDLDTENGDGIVIEQRSRDEITVVGNRKLAPDGIEVEHPAFDVTPAHLVTAIITEVGIARAPYTKSLASLKHSE
jgi:methylthioribose-1-phosphate isomerase